jgi:hypothetical protein
MRGPAQSAIIHGMTKPSVLTTDDGLPSRVQGACDARFVGVVRAFAGLYPGRKFGAGALNFGAPYHATDQQDAVTGRVS